MDFDRRHHPRYLMIERVGSELQSTANGQADLGTPL
jgi:hypothetical protein